MKARILVIDDDPDIVEVLRARLEANDYSVLSASDGEDGLIKIRQEAPDLVVLDIIMPRMDGFNLVKEIKANKETRDIPIIILTAKDKMRDLFEMEGVSEYMVKPFKTEELLEKIKSLLIKQKKIDEY
ncbi:MAG: response regulator [Candidatus Omnitrophota bacterium]